MKIRKTNKICIFLKYKLWKLTYIFSVIFLTIAPDILFKIDFAQASANLPATSDTILVLSDSLNQSSLGRVTGGEFLPEGGWKVTGKDNMIFYDLNTYISHGIMEVKFSNFDPALENTFNRHHFISMYKNKWGEHHQIESFNTDWDLHTGFNYSNGVKLQAAAYEDAKEVILTAKSLKWNVNKTYRLKFIWKGDTVRFFRDNTLLITIGLAHDFSLRYLFLGRDRTISGDYFTNYKNQQYPTMVGPVLSNVIVKKIVDNSINYSSDILYLKTRDIYANAARVVWELSDSAVSKLIFRKVGSTDWDSTDFLSDSRKNEFTLDNLTPAREYEAKVLIKNIYGKITSGASIFFRTNSTDYYFFKPNADSFVERKDIIAPMRDIANMGWLYLMVGNGRICYFKFPDANVGLPLKRAYLRLHVRNVFNSKHNLKIHNVNSDWQENSITWQNQPVFSDSLAGTYLSSKFSRDEWITIPLTTIHKNLKNGLKLAVTSDDSGWVSFDSRESLWDQPELIYDFRINYIVSGNVLTVRNHAVPYVKIAFIHVKKDSNLCPGDTLLTDINGYFESSLMLGENYRILISKDYNTDDISSISIYDAYLTARISVGLDIPNSYEKRTADVNGNGKISLYDALLIAKTSVGLRREGNIGKWIFSSDTGLYNSTLDTVHINTIGYLIGDVDNSWPFISIYENIPKTGQNLGCRILQEEGGESVLTLSGFPVKTFSSFYINIKFDPGALSYEKMVLPDSMKNWQLVQNISDGNIRIALFGTKAHHVNPGDLSFYWRKLLKGNNSDIVIQKIQIDKYVYNNIIYTGISETKAVSRENSLDVFPDPFNETTTILIKMPLDEIFSLNIYNQLGELVKSFRINKMQNIYLWNGKNNNRSPLPSGVYFLALKTKYREFNRKIILLK